MALKTKEEPGFVFPRGFLQQRQKEKAVPSASGYGHESSAVVTGLKLRQQKSPLPAMAGTRRYGLHLPIMAEYII
jgi:hypothetical protein